ncbi:MAG: hypothetical protein ACTSRC_17955 [Candidatus Helarchaeota archaeon]
MISSRNRTILLLIGILFMIVNTVLILLLLDTQLISEYDKQLWNTKITLIINGICFGCFFVTLKFIEHLTIKRLFLIFVLTRIAFCCFFIAFNYGIEFDFVLYSSIPPRVLNGQLFTPYSPFWWSDQWRIFPPMWMWWYTFNFLIYGLDIIFWRVVNLFLEIGIVYVIIQIFRENVNSEKGWNEDNFKMGLTLYIFSFMPIVAILLNANIIAFPVLLGVLGFLYFFRAKKDPKYLYHSVFFFCLVALTEFFAAIWILTILFVLLFRKQFTRLFVVIGEIVAVFCMVALPLLMNDAIGFLQRIFVHYKVTSINWDGTIFAIDWTLFNWPEIISYIPASIALALTIYYIYNNYKSEITLDIFIVIICIFEFFTPIFSPWHFLWIFPLLSLNIIYSFRKFLITTLFFLGYFLFMMLWFVSAYLAYSGPMGPTILDTYQEVFYHYMAPMGYFAMYPLIGQTIFQMGFIYLIYSYTKSKKLVLVLLIVFIIYYSFCICFPMNLEFS